MSFSLVFICSLLLLMCGLFIIFVDDVTYDISFRKKVAKIYFGILSVPIFYSLASIELASDEVIQSTSLIHYINGRAVFKSDFYGSKGYSTNGWINANDYFKTNFDPSQTNIVIIKRLKYNYSLGLFVGDLKSISYLEL